jgi:glycine/D-amino acid oxidase-like deaminating enzyme
MGQLPFRGSVGFEPPPPPPPPRRSALTSPDPFDPFEDRGLFPPPPPRGSLRAQGKAEDDHDDPERRAFDAELRRVAAELDKVGFYLMGC